MMLFVTNELSQLKDHNLGVPYKDIWWGTTPNHIWNNNTQSDMKSINTETRDNQKNIFLLRYLNSEIVSYFCAGVHLCTLVEV